MQSHPASILAIATLIIGMGVNSSWAGMQITPNQGIVPEPAPSPSPSPQDQNLGAPQGQGQSPGEPDPDPMRNLQPGPANPDRPDKEGNLLYPFLSFAQADDPSTESQPSTEATTPTTPTPADPPDVYGERLKQQQDTQPRIFEQQNDIQPHPYVPEKDLPRAPSDDHTRG
jgi:hypothetical protein